jgi:tetratricopeptide (TPR) repeat protein
MKTITFYSYKGGVGRTLTLSNIAIRLSELGKKVCLLDFDLEAPGLHFKFKNNKLQIDKGLVDYIYEYSVNGIIPDKISNYSLPIAPLNSNFRQIDLIPAGNIQSDEYWKKMSMIDWAKMFYSEHGHGVRFILDLKAKIEKELNPDILLIDSRTGITDISGITLKLLADEVVILSSYNEEGLFGTKKIISNIFNNNNALYGNTPKIYFILTRIPFNGQPNEIAKENRVIQKVKSEMLKSLGITEFDISIIHSDRRLEENERQLIGYEYEEKSVSISNDYLKLFDKLTTDILSTEEIELFKNKKIAQNEFIKSQSEVENSKKIQHLNRSIEFDTTQWEYFFYRGTAYAELIEYNKAIHDYNKAIELNPGNAESYINLAYCFDKINEVDKAVDQSTKAIEIDPNLMFAYENLGNYLQKKGEYDKAVSLYNKGLEIDILNDKLYNNRSDVYRFLGDYDNAFSDIYKAIDLNVSEPVYFGTLAEIFASSGKVEEFYFNLNIALGMGMNAESMKTAKDVYEKFRDEERFHNILNKYGIDIDDVLKEL